MVREWLLRRGRLWTGVTCGVLFGAGMGISFYWNGPARSAVGAIVGGVVAGALFGTVMPFALQRTLGTGQLLGLPQLDRLTVQRAVARGEPVSDPRLAPSVLAHARAVMARTQRIRRWRLLYFAFAALELVEAVAKTVTGRVWPAVFFWAATAMFLGGGWVLPRSLDRQRAKAQAAADCAADQIGR